MHIKEYQGGICLKGKIKSISLLLALIMIISTPLSLFAEGNTMPDKDIVKTEEKTEIINTDLQGELEKNNGELGSEKKENKEIVEKESLLNDEPQMKEGVTVTTFEGLKAAIEGEEPIIKVSENIVMTEQLAINREVTIIGLNGATIENGASGLNYMFEVNKNTTFGNLTFDGKNENGAIQSLNANLTIENSKFINNSASNYGAIHIFGNSKLDVRDSNFENNKTDKWYGGAILFENVTETANISNTEFTGNTGKYGGAIAAINSKLNLNLENNVFNNNESGSQGGAIYFYNSSGSITDNSSVFKGNKSESNGGAVYITPNKKGIIANFTGTIFKSNEIITGLGGEASGGDGVKDASMGGALFFYSDKDAEFTVENQLNIINTNFDGNKNTTNPTGTGGAVAIFGLKGSKINISDSQFTGNESTRGGAIVTGNEFEGNFKIEDTVFSNNIAGKGGAIYYNGGGIFDITRSTFKENKANEEFGGAIAFYPENINVTVSGSKFENNSALLGGAILITNGEEDTKSSFTFEETDFSNNSAPSYYGGAIAAMALKGASININNSNFNNNEATNGGAIYIPSVAKNTMAIKNSNFISNTAKEGKGGAIYSNEGTLNIVGGEYENNISTSSTQGNDVGGGAIFIDSDGENYGERAHLNIEDATFKGNSAKSFENEYPAQTGQARGGAIYSGETRNPGIDTLTLSNVIFENNEVYGKQGNGGAIHSDADENTFKNIKFIENKANGGEYSNAEGGTVALRNGWLDADGIKAIGNTAKDSGGAISTSSGGASELIPYKIVNSKFEGNLSGGYGGALYLSKGNITLLNTDFEANKAIKDKGRNDAGAVYIIDSNANITNVNFNNNEANRYGGALTIWGDEENKTIIENSKFNGNKTFRDNFPDLSLGGAIYLTDSALDIKNTEFENNSALSDGGGIHIDSTAGTKIDESSFTNNSAGKNGGAINVLPRTDEVTKDIEDNKYFLPLEVSNTSFANNKAGNGIFELDKVDYPKISETYNANINGIKSLSIPAELDKNIAYNNYDISFISGKEIEEIKIDIKGTKTWEDNNNHDDKRPTSITVNLLADGEKIEKNL